MRLKQWLIINFFQLSIEAMNNLRSYRQKQNCDMAQITWSE